LFPDIAVQLEDFVTLVPDGLRARQPVGGYTQAQDPRAVTEVAKVRLNQ